MLRTSLLTFALLMPIQAAAAWLAIPGGNGFFYDPSSVQPFGQRIKVWGLHNYDQALPLGDRSTMSKKILIEADCLRTQFRTMSYAFQTEPMGGGETIMGYPLSPSSPFGKWRTPEANSFERALFNQVCRTPAPEGTPNEPVEIIDETAPAGSTTTSI